MNTAKKFFSSRSVSSYLLLASFVLGLVGFILYLVNDNSGYLAGRGIDPLGTTFFVLYLVCSLGIFFFEDKLNQFSLLLKLITLGFLVAAFCLFCYERKTVVADIYFIPVNYPDSEKACMNATFVNLLFDLLSFIAFDVSLFLSDKKGEGKALEAK